MRKKRHKNWPQVSVLGVSSHWASGTWHQRCPHAFTCVAVPWQASERNDRYKVRSLLRTMGNKSKGSAQRKMKAKATGRKGKGGYKKDTRCFLSNKAPPISPLTGLALLRVDNGSLICRRCQEGKAYKKGHHRTCPRSKQYDGLAATPKTTKTTRSGGAKPFSDAEKCTRIWMERRNMLRPIGGLERPMLLTGHPSKNLSVPAPPPQVSTLIGMLT